MDVLKYKASLPVKLQRCLGHRYHLLTQRDWFDNLEMWTKRYRILTRHLFDIKTNHSFSPTARVKLFRFSDTSKTSGKPQPLPNSR